MMSLLLQAPLLFGQDTVAGGTAGWNELFFSFLKVLFIVAGLLYTVFAVIVVRQIYSMQKSLVTSFSAPLRLLGYVHLVLSILVLLFFIVRL